MRKILLSVIILLCLSSQAWSDNNWSGSNAAAVWRFENNSNDSVGGNDLTEVNTPTDDNTDYQEGSYSMEFNAGQDEYCTITDANLDAGFPGKSGTSAQSFTVCAFFRIGSLPPNSYYRSIISKYDATGNKRCFGLTVYGNTDKLWWIIGYNNGESFTLLASDNALSANTWYHVGASYDVSDDAMKLRLFYWTGLAWAQVDSNFTGTADGALNCEDAQLDVGRFNLSSKAEMHGELDEVCVIAGEALSNADIDLIRGGTYGAASGGIAPKLINDGLINSGLISLEETGEKTILISVLDDSLFRFCRGDRPWEYSRGLDSSVSLVHDRR